MNRIATLLLGLGLSLALGLGLATFAGRASAQLPEPERALTLSFVNQFQVFQANDLAFPPVDLLNTALAQLGYRMHVVLQPGLRSVQSANSGRTDGELLRVAGLEARYPNLVRVPEPLLLGELDAFVLADSPLNDWNEFRQGTLLLDKEIALVSEVLPRKLSVRPRLVANDLPQAVQLLVRQRGQLLVGPASLTELIIAQGERQGTRIRRLPSPLSQDPLYLYLHRDHRALAAPLAKRLRALKKACNYRDHMPASCAQLQPYVPHGAQKRP